MTGSQAPLTPPINTDNATNADGRGDGLGLGRSYSIQQTPAEYHGPEFPSSQQARTRSDADELPHIVESPSSPRAPSYGSSPHNPSNGQRASSRVGSPPPNPSSSPPRSPEPASYPPNAASPPPLSDHPANFAPYAEPSPMSPNPSGRSETPPVQPSNPPKPARTSTTPQPVHAAHAATAADAQQRREKEWGVVPDDNPLASPTSTSTFPPNNNPHLGGQNAHHDQDTSHRPGQVMHPSQQIRGGVWSHSLCDCSDVGVCCTGVWCPCILYGRTQYRLSMKSERKDPTNMLGYETCNASCTGMALLCGCQCTSRHTPLFFFFFNTSTVSH